MESPLRILLTGPKGQIGWELERELARLGEVVPRARDALDLRLPNQVHQQVDAVKPDLIVNAAGYTAVDRAERESDEAIRVNAEGPRTLAIAAGRCGAAIVHLSTDYVFDGAKQEPYTPADPPNPLNAYGRSKLAGEEAIVATGVPHLILRTSWVFSLRGSNFLRTMLRLAETETEIRVVNDQSGCPTWSRLVARGATDVIERSLVGHRGARHFGGHEGVYHLACAGSTTWFGLAQHIIGVADLRTSPRLIPITTDEYPTDAARPRYSVLDCRRTTERFGIQLMDWKDAVQQALASRGDPMVSAGTEVQR